MSKPAIMLLLFAGTSYANPRVEVGVSFGAHAFANDVELGVADAASEPSPDDSGLLGARVALPFTNRFAAEAELNVIPTKDDVLGDAATVFGLLAHARFDILTGRLRPFAVAGVGAHFLRSTSPQMDNDADKALYWGLGARYGLTDELDLRLDGRHLIVPGRTENGATSDFELSAGVSYRFGNTKPPVRPAAHAIVPNLGDLDRDGIVDANDRCPNEPESKNGWQDEDGCADKVIEELAGIGFELRSARIDVESAPILNRAYQILKDNPQVSVEIAGHTSSEGDEDRNLELSLRRAEAVRNQLVKRGIAVARILTVGYGSQEPIAENYTEEGRRKNRRIEFRILTSVE